MTSDAIVWFRRDLRLDDNAAWAAATSEHDRVTALVVLEPTLLDRAGRHRRGAYLRALRRLDEQLAASGGRLRVEQGDPAAIVPAVAAEADAEAVHCNADVTRWSARRDAAVCSNLAVELVPHWATLVHPPGTVLTKAGTLSRVFSAFHRRWAQLPLPVRCEAGDAVVADRTGPGLPDDGEPHDETLLDETLLHETLLDAWLRQVDDYDETRDLPAVSGTSSLSTALRFGTISGSDAARRVGTATEGRAAFVRQLAWRDWYAHLTHEQPDIDRVALRPEYDRIPWETGPQADQAFVAWREGRTGFPIVDAGMRELTETGWMHNRVRMITASFLVKGSPRRLAARRAPFPPSASRRRHPPERRELAVGGGNRARCRSLLPDLQPRATKPSIRPGGCLSAALAARARRPR